MKDNTPGKQGSDLCRSCGLCCNGAVCNVALVSPKDDREFAELFSHELVAEPGYETLCVNLPCFAYKGHCTHYNIRPVDCKTYQCALLKKYMTGETTFESASKTIKMALTSLDSATAQYNALYSQSLTRNKIAPVLTKLKHEAQTKDQQKAFWLRFPAYMTFCFLKTKHFTE